MLIVRIAKIILVASMASLATLVAFGNITDYQTNFVFVQHVLLMDTVFPNADIKYRALPALAWHHVSYSVIIACEILMAGLCWQGVYAMLRTLRYPALAFNRAKRCAIAGLIVGFLVWQFGFMTIGGEWFGMWMSSEWNALEAAFRFSMIVIAVLIYISAADEELTPSH